MTQIVDYTQWSTRRKSLHQLPIHTCPKCGRNGEHTVCQVSPRVRVDWYTHLGEIVTMGGLRYFSPSETCMIRTEEREGQDS
jgi:hypothetical protein